MQTLERKMNAFRDRFTRAFVRFYHGPIESVGSFKGYPSEEDVYWFESDSAAFGQATPVGTITLNKQRMKNLSDEAAELVYRHERGHLNRLPLLRGLFYGMVINGAIGIYYLLSSLGYSLLIPFGMPLEPVAKLAGVSLLLILAFVITVRLEELAADLHALRALGEEEFLNAYGEISSESSQSLHNEVAKFLLYTKLDNVVRVHRFINWLKTE